MRTVSPQQLQQQIEQQRQSLTSVLERWAVGQLRSLVDPNGVYSLEVQAAVAKAVYEVVKGAENVKLAGEIYGEINKDLLRELLEAENEEA